MIATAIENYGLVKISDAKTGLPLSGIYVKCYAKKQSEIVFFRDGYTNFVGKFDYALSSGTDIDAI